MAKKISYLLTLVSFFGLSASIAHAENMAEDNALTALNAQFETTECARPCKKPAKHSWWMWRTPEKVELRKVASANSELWTLEAGKTNYAFLMHDEKKLIDYSNTDLKMLDQSMDANKWEAVTTLVTQKELANMRKKSLKRQYQGLSLTQYDGKIKGVEAHITWIPALQVPLKITYVYPKHQLTVNLMSHGEQAASVTAVTEQALLTYERIDYTDIGDMEHSANAKVWLSKAIDAPGIHSHHH